MQEIKKWGFGAAPLKEKQENRYKYNLTVVLSYIHNISMPVSESLLNSISEVKGLFNRIIKQDQWDWFTVNMYFDYPSNKELVKIVCLLSDLRRNVKELNMTQIEKTVERILKTNFTQYSQNFLEFSNKPDTDDYIYILSRRDNKDLLKIGMTTRNVIKRCNEINSATGIVFPFSPRKVFRVYDVSYSEKLVHKELAQYRIRNDREFFILSYSKACEMIEKILIDNNMMYYKYDNKEK